MSSAAPSSDVAMAIVAEGSAAKLGEHVEELRRIIGATCDFDADTLLREAVIATRKARAQLLLVAEECRERSGTKAVLRG